MTERQMAKTLQEHKEWTNNQRRGHRADLRAVNMRFMDLSGADLRMADLRAADLYKATLTDADLSNADLRGANLSHADCRRCNFTNANLLGADLAGADLRGATMDYSKVAGARLGLEQQSRAHAGSRGEQTAATEVQPPGAARGGREQGPEADRHSSLVDEAKARGAQLRQTEAGRDHTRQHEQDHGRG